MGCNVSPIGIMLITSPSDVTPYLPIVRLWGHGCPVQLNQFSVIFAKSHVQCQCRCTVLCLSNTRESWNEGKCLSTDVIYIYSLHIWTLVTRVTCQRLTDVLGSNNCGWLIRRHDRYISLLSNKQQLPSLEWCY